MRHVASVAVVKNGKLLWIKRRDNGLLTLPGGHLNEGEHPQEGAIRELMEETGLSPNGGEIRYVGSGQTPTHIVHSFTCTVTGEPSNAHDPDSEATGYHWLDSLPNNVHVPHGNNITLLHLGLAQPNPGVVLHVAKSLLKVEQSESKHPDAARMPPDVFKDRREEFEASCATGDSWLHRRAFERGIWRPVITGHDIDKALDAPDPGVAHAALEVSHAVTPEHIAKATQHPEPTVRGKALAHPFTPPEARLKLVGGATTAHDRRAVEALFDQIVHRPNAQFDPHYHDLVDALIKSPLAESDISFVADKALGRYGGPKPKPEHLQHFLHHADAQARLAAVSAATAHQIALGDDDFERLVHDSSEAVRNAMWATSSRDPINRLKAHHVDHFVKSWMENPKQHSRVLANLAAHATYVDTQFPFTTEHRKAIVDHMARNPALLDTISPLALRDSKVKVTERERDGAADLAQHVLALHRQPGVDRDAAIILQKSLIHHGWLPQDQLEGVVHDPAQLPDTQHNALNKLIGNWRAGRSQAEDEENPQSTPDWWVRAINHPRMSLRREAALSYIPKTPDETQLLLDKVLEPNEPVDDSPHRMFTAQRIFVDIAADLFGSRNDGTNSTPEQRSRVLAHALKLPTNDAAGGGSGADAIGTILEETNNSDRPLPPEQLIQILQRPDLKRLHSRVVNFHASYENHPDFIQAALASPSPEAQVAALRNAGPGTIPPDHLAKLAWNGAKANPNFWANPHHYKFLPPEQVHKFLSKTAFGDYDSGVSQFMHQRGRELRRNDDGTERIPTPEEVSSFNTMAESAWSNRYRKEQTDWLEGCPVTDKVLGGLLTKHPGKLPRIVGGNNFIHPEQLQRIYEHAVKNADAVPDTVSPKAHERVIEGLQSAVATHPSVSSQVLEALLNHPKTTLNTKNKALQNPAAGPLVEKFSTPEHQDLHEAIWSNTNAPPSALARILRHDATFWPARNVPLVQTISNNPDIIRSYNNGKTFEHPDVQKAIIDHPWFAWSHNPMGTGANYIKWKPEMVRYGVEKLHSELSRELAVPNEDLQSDLIGSLSDGLGAAIQHPHFPADWLSKLWNDRAIKVGAEHGRRGDSVQKAIIRRPGPVPQALLVHALADPELSLDALKRPDVTPDLIAPVLESPGPERWSALLHPNSPSTPEQIQANYFDARRTLQLEEQGKVPDRDALRRAHMLNEIPRRIQRHPKLTPQVAWSMYRNGNRQLVGHPAIPNSTLKRALEAGIQDDSDYAAHEAFKAALTNPKVTSGQLVDLLSRGDRMDDDLKAELKLAIALHDPDYSFEHKMVGHERQEKFHERTRIAVPSVSTEKLRILRDKIEGMGGNVHKNKLPGFPASLVPFTDAKGFITAVGVQKAIDSLPKEEYWVGDYAPWTGGQRHSQENSNVFQVEVTTNLVNRLKAEGAFGLYARLQRYLAHAGHPTGIRSIGWVRWTGDKTGIHMEETQSDLSQARIGDEVGVKYEPQANAAMRKVLWGSRKTAQDLLAETFMHWMRQDPDMVNTPLHWPSHELKTSMGADPPQDTYKRLPADLGFEEKAGRYGQLPTQSSKQLKDKPTHISKVRKTEDWGVFDDLTKATKYWKSKDGLKIPHHTDPARKEWDLGFHNALVNVFANGDTRRLKPLKIPVAEHMLGHFVQQKAIGAGGRNRVPLYTRMLTGGDKLPPVVVRRNGISWTVIDGNARLTAALKHGKVQELDALELVDPPTKKSEDMLHQPPLPGTVFQGPSGHWSYWTDKGRPAEAYEHEEHAHQAAKKFLDGLAQEKAKREAALRDMAARQHDDIILD
jgi:ADP-ribose pyrophosphatase YjhB (NUDIX family)